MTDFIKQQQELGKSLPYIACGCYDLECTNRTYTEQEIDTLIAKIITNTGEELMRIIKDERNKIPDKFEQPFELAENVGSKMTLDTLKKHIISVTGVE